MQNPGPANKLHPKTALGEIARVFLRLGFIAFGGPAAHMALMEEEFVRRRAWVTRERFLDLGGAVSLLPGPSSTELAIYLGQIRGGVLGLILAGAAFILPAAFLVVALAWACARFGTAPQLAGLLGVKPAVVVLIAQAIDRKSTRLNSSHRCISYAVFCLKKKKTRRYAMTRNQMR